LTVLGHFFFLARCQVMAIKNIPRPAKIRAIRYPWVSESMVR
jgi:hypothetical protein